MQCLRVQDYHKHCRTFAAPPASFKTTNRVIILRSVSVPTVQDDNAECSIIDTQSGFRITLSMLDVLFARFAPAGRPGRTSPASAQGCAGRSRHPGGLTRSELGRVRGCLGGIRPGSIAVLAVFSSESGTLMTSTFTMTKSKESCVCCLYCWCTMCVPYKHTHTLTHTHTRASIDTDSDKQRQAQT